LKRILGGAIGLGLKQIVQEAYAFLAANYQRGDEIYIFGFSRGAYEARALAGLIGASGIHRTPTPESFEAAWNYYRVKPSVRRSPAEASGSDKKAIGEQRSLRAQSAVHENVPVKCVGVWDTVGSYGIPAGFGLAPLARYFSWLVLGFHDTSFGDHIDVGLHALAVDERRRPFVPTFWTMPKDQSPKGHVEQTWFAGVHRNVGGGYPSSGLSDLALIWMIARVQALTGLEFDMANVREATKAANLDGEVYDSARDWPISRAFPYWRKILPPNAIHHGPFFNSEDPNKERINERIHWSVLRKRGRPCTVFGVPDTPYKPPNPNMPATPAIAPERIAAITPEEAALMPALAQV
jgi:uncharacterized protein (DUF2235 family)